MAQRGAPALLTRTTGAPSHQILQQERAGRAGPPHNAHVTRRLWRRERRPGAGGRDRSTRGCAPKRRSRAPGPIGSLPSPMAWPGPRLPCPHARAGRVLGPWSSVLPQWYWRWSLRMGPARSGRLARRRAGWGVVGCGSDRAGTTTTREYACSRPHPTPTLCSAASRTAPQCPFGGSRPSERQRISRMASMMVRDLGPMLTASEVAEMLHLHVNTVKRLGDRGELPFYRVCKRGDRRFRLDDVMAFLARNR